MLVVSRIWALSDLRQQSACNKQHHTNRGTIHERSFPSHRVPKHSAQMTLPVPVRSETLRGYPATHPNSWFPMDKCFQRSHIAPQTPIQLHSADDTRLQLTPRATRNKQLHRTS